MNNYFDLVNQYIDGTLSDSVKHKFEAEMETNESLQFAVQEHQLVSSMQEQLIEKDIQASIDQVKEATVTTQTANVKDLPNPRSSIFSLRRIAVAASAIGLIALAFLLTQQSDRTAMNKDALYAEVYRPSVSEVVRGENEQQSTSNCDMAHIKMDKGQFVEAKNLYQKLLINKDAIDCDYKASWHLALVGLMLDDEQLMNQHLDKIIADAKHPYHQKALVVQKGIVEN